MIYGVSKVILSKNTLKTAETPSKMDQDLDLRTAHVEESYVYFFHKLNLEGYKLLNEPMEPVTFTFPVHLCDSETQKIVDMALTKDESTILALSEHSRYQIHDLQHSKWLDQIDYECKLVAYDINSEMPQKLTMLNLNKISKKYKIKKLGRAIRIKRMPLNNNFGVLTDQGYFLIIHYHEKGQKFDFWHLLNLNKITTVQNKVDNTKFDDMKDDKLELQEDNFAKFQGSDFNFCGDFIYVMMKERDLKIYEIKLRSREYYARQVGKMIYDWALRLWDEKLALQEEKQLENGGNGGIAAEELKMNFGLQNGSQEDGELEIIEEEIE